MDSINLGYMESVNQKEFKRYCKTLELREDDALIEAYKNAHAEGQAWPEVTEGLRSIGVLDMEIYIFKNRLFMIMDTVVEFDHEVAFAKLAKMPRQAEWEASMARFQRVNPESAADEKWQLIERIFKLGL